MTHYEIVMKLIGNVTPVGDAAIDKDRLGNLTNLCELVDDLVLIIDSVASLRNEHQASVKKAGQYAKNFLTNRLGITE